MLQADLENIQGKRKTMNKPLIGLTSYHRNEDDRFTIPAKYLEAVEGAGGIPVVITPTSENLDGLIKKLDGLVLSGGADIDPAEYDGEQKDSVYGINHERDRYELDLVRRTLKEHLPTLAICRGLQVLNVALGGTLVEHIPDEYGEEVVHRGENLNKVEHSVSIDPGSRLASILKNTEFDCPSYHHQAVRDLAPGFKIVAKSEDGVIEAIESDEYPEVIAVQWHPEYTADNDPNQQRLFDTLVKWSRGVVSETEPIAQELLDSPKAVA